MQERDDAPFLCCGTLTHSTIIYIAYAAESSCMSSGDSGVQINSDLIATKKAAFSGSFIIALSQTITKKKNKEKKLGGRFSRLL